MKTQLLLLTCALLLCLSSCRDQSATKHGQTKTDTRALGSGAFSRISIEAPLDATIKVGGAASLSFKGADDVLRYLRTEVRDGTLRIFVDHDLDLDDKPGIAATISLPSLSAISISGAGYALIEGDINTPHFNVDLSGAGSVDVRKIHAQSFDASLSGAASLHMDAGEIGDGKYEVSGTGEVNAYGVTQRMVHVSIDGTGDASVTATEKLDVEISGNGAVKFKGHPVVTQNISGVGSVMDAN